MSDATSYSNQAITGDPFGNIYFLSRAPSSPSTFISKLPFDVSLTNPITSICTKSAFASSVLNGTAFAFDAVTQKFYFLDSGLGFDSVIDYPCSGFSRLTGGLLIAQGMVLDSSGNLYASIDYSSPSLGIYKIDKTSGAPTTLVSPSLVSWDSMTADANGNIYGVNRRTGNVEALIAPDPTTGVRTLITLANFPLTAYTLTGIAINASGEIYVTSSGSVTIPSTSAKIMKLSRP